MIIFYFLIFIAELKKNYKLYSCEITSHQFLMPLQGNAFFEK